MHWMALAACGAIDADRANKLQDIYREYRQRQHHLVLNDEKPLMPSGEFREQRDFVRRTWDEVFRT